MNNPITLAVIAFLVVAVVIKLVVKYSSSCRKNALQKLYDCYIKFEDRAGCDNADELFTKTVRPIFRTYTFTEKDRSPSTLLFTERELYLSAVRSLELRIAQAEDAHCTMVRDPHFCQKQLEGSKTEIERMKLGLAELEILRDKIPPLPPPTFNQLIARIPHTDPSA